MYIKNNSLLFTQSIRTELIDEPEVFVYDCTNSKLQYLIFLPIKLHRFQLNEH